MQAGRGSRNRTFILGKEGLVPCAVLFGRRPLDIGRQRHAAVGLEPLIERNGSFDADDCPPAFPNEDGQLRYAGKVGSGFTRANRAELLAALRPLVTDESHFLNVLPRRIAAASTWVRPEVVIRAEFAGWVGDGMVRQASYKGIDLGKDARSVVREAPG